MKLESVFRRSFQVVPFLLQVDSSHFWLVVGRFRSFPARCRSFQVVPRFSKYVILDIWQGYEYAYVKITSYLTFVQTYCQITLSLW